MIEAGIMRIMPSSDSASTVAPNRPSLTLVCTGLAALIARSDVALPSLARLLAQAESKPVRTNSCNTLDDWQSEFISTMGFDDAAHFPSAPLTWLGTSEMCTDDHRALTWLQVEPAMLTMSAEGMSLHALSVTGEWPIEVLDEVASLVTKDLAAMDWNWYRCGNRAFLARRAPLSATTTTLNRAFTLSLRDALPSGADSAELRRLMTELQMLIHEKIRTAPRLNSLWLSGIGKIPTTVPFIGQPPMLWSDASSRPYAIGVYRSQQWSSYSHAVPESFLELQGQLRATNVVALDARQAALDERWFAPLLSAIAGKHLDRLTLCMDGWTCVIRPSIWRRWLSRPKPIAEYFA